MADRSGSGLSDSRRSPARNTRLVLKRKRRSPLAWAEDHASPLIWTAVGLWLVTGGTLLLWRATRVFIFARALEPFLVMLTVTFSVAFAALRWLKSRHDRRPAGPDGSEPPSAESSDSPAGSQAPDGVGHVPGTGNRRPGRELS
jgi:hypothetical protein